MTTHADKYIPPKSALGKARRSIKVQQTESEPQRGRQMVHHLNVNQLKVIDGLLKTGLFGKNRTVVAMRLLDEALITKAREFNITL